MRYSSLGKTEQEALLATLQDMPAFLEGALGALSADEAALRGPNGTFSPVEQCWHLADLEREGYGARIHRLLTEERPFLPDFEGDRIAEERRYRSLALAEGLRAFREARNATLARLRLVAAPEWDRTGRQEGVGEIALCDIPAMMAEHDAAHRREIEAWKRERGEGRKGS
jgi:hypothetical protein